jgi:hypothetical protein
VFVHFSKERKMESSNHRYGTKNAPLTIELARATIREDFLKFASHVVESVNLPQGYGFANHPGFELKHQLTWHSGCEIRSSHGGLSLHGSRSVSCEKDATQISIEIRIFHPELHFRNGQQKPQVSRQYNNGFSAHLWVNQGRPFWGMHKSLIEGNQFCREAATVEELAQSVVQRLTAALANRQPVEQEIETTEQAAA